MSHPESPVLIPHSFVQLHYITTNPDRLTEEMPLDTSLEEWITDIAIPSRAIARFATFSIVQGFVTVGSREVAVRSNEQYDLSGTTYIDGVICSPTKSDVLEGLASMSVEGEVCENNSAFVIKSLAALRRRQKPDRVVISRFGDAIFAFDTEKDNILETEDY